MLSRGYEFIALTIFEENLNLSEKFSRSRQASQLRVTSCDDLSLTRTQWKVAYPE